MGVYIIKVYVIQTKSAHNPESNRENFGPQNYQYYSLLFLNLTINVTLQATIENACVTENRIQYILEPFVKRFKIFAFNRKFCRGE